jgi:hypothetical protein
MLCRFSIKILFCLRSANLLLSLCLGGCVGGAKSSAKGVESMDLVSLVEELKRRKLNSFDIITEDEDMAVFPN